MELSPFNYYVTANSTPLLCEIDSSGFVYFPDSCTIKHRTSYGGEFRKLIEAPAQPAPVDYETVVVVYPATVPGEGEA